MKRSSFAAGALLIAFIASSTGWAAPAKSSRPKLSSFKLVVVAPRAEIQDSKGKVLATIQQGYVVWPTLYGKGHYKVKCQDKKAKGGWIDGWIYEPFPSSEAEIDTYDQEDAILRQMRIWQYDVDNWKNGGEVDSTQQIYEGEDFNLDGAFDNGAYHFSAKNLEIVRGETDPFQFSSDLDSIPDGYEVWYAQFEPLLTQDGLNYLIDPRANDGDNDCDVNFSVMGDIKVSNASTHAKGGNYPVSIGEPESGSTIYSIAQNFTIIQNGISRI